MKVTILHTADALEPPVDPVLDAPLGRAYRAVAPFAPEPPYRLYAGVGHEPVAVPDTSSLVVVGEEVTALLVRLRVEVPCHEMSARCSQRQEFDQ